MYRLKVCLLRSKYFNWSSWGTLCQIPTLQFFSSHTHTRLTYVHFSAWNCSLRLTQLLFIDDHFSGNSGFFFRWHWVILQYSSKLKFQFHFLFFDNLGNEVDGHFLLDSNNFRCLRYFTKVFKDWLSFWNGVKAKKSFHAFVRSLKFTYNLLRRPLAKKFSKFTKLLLQIRTSVCFSAL